MFVSAHLMSFFFFNDTATTEIYTLSLHDALPILIGACLGGGLMHNSARSCRCSTSSGELLGDRRTRSEEHTSELQSRLHLVCRLLLEKKKKECQCVISNTAYEYKTATVNTCVGAH